MEEKGLEYQTMVLVVYISSIWTPLWYTCLHFDKEDSLLYNEKISQMELLKFFTFCVNGCKENTNWNENMEALQIIL